MNCETFQREAMDWARRRLLPPEAGEHRSTCGVCAAVWDRETALSAALGDLQDVPGPAPRFEAAVLEQWKRRQSSRWRWPVAWAAAAAAALLVAILISRRQPPARAQFETLDFLPLRAGPVFVPGESARLVRIRLRSSEARRFGLPVSVDGDARPVDAEVWIGEDGAARAVRFLPVSETVKE
ncbi:MAG: hypothetical protein U0Q16_07650 [Bryobacteraceae bacterium]